MKKASLFMAIICTFVFIFAGCNVTTSRTDIVVLYTNDVHCGVDDTIGYAGMAALKQDYIDAGNEVLLVDCGDAIQGAPIGTISEGEYIVDIMNEMDYDVATLGNHEFDYGSARILELAEKAEYPYVCCNFRYIGTDELVFDAYKMITVSGVQIAFVGILTPATITSSAPVYFQDENGEYLFDLAQGDNGQELYDCVQSAIDDARSNGADYVVALGHLGLEEACSPWTSKEVIANTEGLDVLLDGHSHDTVEGETVKDKNGDDVILTQTGTKLAAVGALTITTDGEISTELIYEDYTKKDTEIDTFIKSIQSEFNAELQTVVAKSLVDLTINNPETGERMVRNSETNLGDLCADAYRFMSGADVAFVNGGGIRDNLAAGDITYEEILTVNPFGNALCVVETTGQDILDALELASMNYPNEDGSFLHVSGMEYTIDSSVKSSVQLDENGMFAGVSGEYRVKNVKIGGEPIDLEKTYTLACHDYFIKNCGGGMNMFLDDKLLQDCTMLDNQVLINYIVDYLDGTVGEEYANPYGQGRITFK